MVKQSRQSCRKETTNERPLQKSVYNVQRVGFRSLVENLWDSLGEEKSLNQQFLKPKRDLVESSWRK